MKKALTILFVGFLILAYQGFSELQAQSSSSRSTSRSSSRSTGIARTYTPDTDVYVSSWTRQDEGSSHLSLSKMYENESASKEGNFSVEENYNMLKIDLEGAVKEGSIGITIYTPDGDIFKDLEIDNSADVRWSKIFGEYKEDYVGEWTYEIEADGCTGRYSLSITTH